MKKSIYDKMFYGVKEQIESIEKLESINAPKDVIEKEERLLEFMKEAFGNKTGVEYDSDWSLFLVLAHNQKEFDRRYEIVKQNIGGAK